MSCPPTEILEQLLAQEPPANGSGEVWAHVRSCPLCQAQLDELTAATDLRCWKPPHGFCAAPAVEEPGLAALRVDLRKARIQVSSGKTAQPLNGQRTYSFLGPPRRAGDLGTLGPYLVEACLAEGGMGIVFRAYDEALQRPVALKALRPELADVRARERFVREAHAAARVRHERIVDIHAVVNPPDGLPYLVMEYLPGESLSTRIRARNGLEARAAAELIARVAEGVAAAHAAGLIHRDIKPANIMVDAVTGQVKITDFGLARGAGHLSGITAEGVIAGTPAYMSPEQVLGTKALDVRSDVYSLGVTLYEALVGEVPFRGSPNQVLERVLNQDPVPPRDLNGAVPRDLETICLKAMAKQPSHRFGSAQALADDLRRWLRGEPIEARPVGRIQRAWRWCRRKPLVASLAAALLLAVSAGVAGISWKWAEAVEQRQRAEHDRDEADRQRRRAERSLRQAREAVDTYLTGVSENADLKAHAFERLRRDLLKTAQGFYERFVEENLAEPDLQAQLGRAYWRLGQITRTLEPRTHGLEFYQKMQAVFDRLCEQYPGNSEYESELAESHLQQAGVYRITGSKGQGRLCLPASPGAGPGPGPALPARAGVCLPPGARVPGGRPLLPVHRLLQPVRDIPDRGPQAACRVLGGGRQRGRLDGGASGWLGVRPRPGALEPEQAVRPDRAPAPAPRDLRRRRILAGAASPGPPRAAGLRAGADHLPERAGRRLLVRGAPRPGGSDAAQGGAGSRGPGPRPPDP
jgi:Protein kinase domain